jgi:hypothetical protein
MKACEIFQQMSPALGAQIVSYLRTEQKPVWRAALQALATQRKLRLEYVQKKSGPEQAEFCMKGLKSTLGDVISSQVLQVWLMKAKSQMLADFLDGLGIQHDGQGAVGGDIPTDFDEAKTTASIATLLEKYPHEEVATYLHTFQLQQPGGWATVAKVMANEPKIKLG